jgi:cephalosporin hydroxylase
MAIDDQLRTRVLATVVESDRYGFTYFWRWLGLLIIQVPDDIVKMHQIVWETKSHVLIETGGLR